MVTQERRVGGAARRGEGGGVQTEGQGDEGRGQPAVHTWPSGTSGMPFFTKASIASSCVAASTGTGARRAASVSRAKPEMRSGPIAGGWKHRRAQGSELGYGSGGGAWAHGRGNLRAASR